MMSVQRSEIEDFVKGALGMRFPRMHVVRVAVRETEDDDGDDILEITVIFEAKKGDFDPAEVPSFLNSVMPRLMAEKHAPFPIFSFVSKSDWGNRKTAAA